MCPTFYYIIFYAKCQVDKIQKICIISSFLSFSMPFLLAQQLHVHNRRHLNLKSTPTRVISQTLLPQGCCFFISILSPILYSIFYLFFYFCIVILLFICYNKSNLYLVRLAQINPKFKFIYHTSY